MNLRGWGTRKKWWAGNGKTCGCGGGTVQSLCFALIFDAAVSSRYVLPFYQEKVTNSIRPAY